MRITAGFVVQGSKLFGVGPTRLDAMRLVDSAEIVMKNSTLDSQ